MKPRLFSRFAATMCGLTLAVGAATVPAAHADIADALPMGSTGASHCTSNIAVIVPGGVQSIAGLPESMSTGGFTSGIAMKLDAQGISARTASYTAAPWVFNSYDASSRAGLQRVSDAVSRAAAECPGSNISLVGYSEGAGIASKLASQIGAGHGPISEDRLGRVALIANPYKGNAAEHLSGTKPDGEGALGAMNSYGKAKDKVLDICNAGDFVCDSHAIPGVSEVAGRLITVGLLTGTGDMTIHDLGFIARNTWLMFQGGQAHTQSYAATGASTDAVNFIAHH